MHPLLAEKKCSCELSVSASDLWKLGYIEPYTDACEGVGVSNDFHEGGCLCGAVRYRARGEPMRTLICHCTSCQKMTGSSFYAESMFSIDAVEFHGQSMGCYTHVSDSSGKRVFMHFCTMCATTVTLTFESLAGVPSDFQGNV